MRNSIKIILFIFILITGISSCNTGKNLYTQGNYYQAVLRSIEKLRKSPNNKKAMETLANAYPNALTTFLDQIENKNQSQAAFKNTEVAYIYQQLNNLYENIQKSPVAKNIIKRPGKFYDQLELIKPIAAEEQYASGLKFLSYGDRSSAKQAYFYFLEADNFVNNYKDVSAKIAEAYNLSILHVLTNLVPVHSKIYKLSADLFYTEVQRIFNQIEQKEFVQFHTAKEAEKMQIKNTNQLLEINFEDFIVGETHTKEWIENIVSDSLKIGQVTLDDGSKKEVIGVVKAKVSINRMEVISKGLINLTIKENKDDKDLINDNIVGEYVWFNEWGHYNGDERALTVEQIEITNRKRINPAPPQQMFVEFTKPIYEQLRTRLFTFYENY